MISSILDLFMILLVLGASVKASTDDLLSFSTCYRWLHLKSNNHLYLRWHQSEGANNMVNIGDECSQHWAAVLARKKINARQVLPIGVY